MSNRGQIYWLVDALRNARHDEAVMDDEVGSEYYPINLDDAYELEDGEFSLIFAKHDDLGIDYDDKYTLKISVMVS